MMKKIWLFLFVFPLTVFGQALPAVLTNDTILVKANSPFLLPVNFTVNAGVTLTIEAGVILEIPLNGVLNINGSILANGTESDSVYLKSQVVGNRWQQINTNHAEVIFTYCSITGGRRFINASGGRNIRIDNCRISSTATSGSGEDCIAVHDAEKVLIDHIILTGTAGSIAEGSKHDAIDLDHVDSCFIKNSVISMFSDDGIDIGTETGYAFISDNFISHCNYGISVGESTTGYAENNILTYNDAGIQVHNGAVLYCFKNTLYANSYGIEAYHSEEGSVQTGGTAVLTNTIFAATRNNELLLQSTSDVTVSYSLSDNELLPGQNNLFANPLFTNATGNNFRLSPESPCLNSGMPDTLGNPTVIGAVDEVMEPSGLNDLYFSEIFVFPDPARDVLCFGKLQSETGIYVRITDLNGKTVLQKYLEPEADRIEIEKLKTGMYFISFFNDEMQSRVLPFIKE